METEKGVGRKGFPNADGLVQDLPKDDWIDQRRWRRRGADTDTGQEERMRIMTIRLQNYKRFTELAIARCRASTRNCGRTCSATLERGGRQLAGIFDAPVAVVLGRTMGDRR